MSAATVGSTRSTEAGAQLRLTARGRRVVRLGGWLVVTAVVVLALLLAWLVAASVVAPGASAGDGSGAVRSGVEVREPQEVVEVVVLPGDTLWGIAREHAPSQDPRSVVAAVVELNDLSDAAVQAGEALRVPVG